MSILSYLSMRTKSKEQGLFRDLTPEDNHIQDIAVLNPSLSPGACSTSPVLLDISLATPIGGVAAAGEYPQVSVYVTTHPGRAAII